MRQRKRTSGFLIGGALTLALSALAPAVYAQGAGGGAGGGGAGAAGGGAAMGGSANTGDAATAPTASETRGPRQAILPRARRDRLRLALPTTRAVAQR